MLGNIGVIVGQWNGKIPLDVEICTTLESVGRKLMCLLVRV